MKTQKFALSIMAVSVISAMSSVRAADSPFSIPSHLSAPVLIETVNTSREVTEQFSQSGQTTVTTGAGVKPNIMLYIDDSGSMSWAVAGQSGTSSQMITHEDVPWTGYCNYDYTQNKVVNLYDSSEWVWSYCNNDPAHQAYTLGTNSRMYNVTTAIKELLDQPDPNTPTKTYADMANWGLFWMNTAGVGNYPGANTNVVNINDTSVNDVKKALDKGLAYNTRTPLAAAYVRATDWLSRNIDYRCQKSYLVMFSDGDANDGYLKRILSSNVAPLWKDFQNTRNIEYAGTAYLYELGDYLHNLDFKSAADGVDKAGKSWDDPEFKNQQIVTFSMITDDNAQYIQDDTKAMATKNYRNARGEIVQTAWTVGLDKQSLYDAFATIFSSISDSQTQNVPGAVSQSQDSRTRQESDPQSGSGWGIEGKTSSYAAVSPSVTGSTGEIVPGEAATVYVYPNLRASELRFYKVNESGVEGFGLSANTSHYTTAKINVDRWRLFTNAKGEKGFHDLLGNDFTNNKSLGLKERTETNKTDEWKQAMLPWISRRVTDAVIQQRVSANDYDTAYRTRDDAEYGMGDVINGNVVAIGNLGANGRAEYMLVNANDGMAYIFQNTGNDDQPYVLRTNYIPTAMPRADKNDDTVGHYYPHIANPDYSISQKYPHLYMMDGDITAQTVSLFDNSSPVNSATYAVGNMGRGARGVYALDLQKGNRTNQTNGMFSVTYEDKVNARTTDLVKFEKTARDDDAMGYTVPTSTAGRVKQGLYTHLAAFVASGYAHPNVQTQESALYLYNMFGNTDFSINGGKTNKATGELLAKVVVGNTGGLSAPTLLDIDLNGVIDYVFAGDYEGNMWRFDVRDINNISYQKIFEPANKWIDVPESDTATVNVKRPARPITSAPGIASHDNGNYVVVFGTGSDLYNDDLHTKRQQAVYGIYQHFDVNGDLSIQAPNTTAIKIGTVRESELLTQEFVVDPMGDSGIRYATNETINKDNKAVGYPGWKLLLDSNNGERIVTKPVVALGSVYLISRWYTANYAKFNEDEEFDPNNPESNGWASSGYTSNDLTEAQKAMCSSDAPEYTGSDDKDPNTGWSKWVDDPNGGNTGTSVSNDPCISVTSTSNIKRTCSYTYHETRPYSRSTQGNVKSNSALIQISSHNGGAILSSERRKLGTTYLSFFDNEHDTLGYMASKTYDGIMAMTITGWTFIRDTIDLAGNKVASNTTTAGDSSGSGHLMDPTTQKRQTNNKVWMSCGGGKDMAGAGLTIITSTGNTDFAKVMGGTMQCGTRRISWREVF